MQVALGNVLGVGGVHTMGWPDRRGLHESPARQIETTTGVIELTEQTIIDELVARLTSRYPNVPAATVSTVVWDIHSRFDGSRLRDFVPLLVERNAKKELDGRGPNGG
jgi:hypothetical protein